MSPTAVLVAPFDVSVIQSLPLLITRYPPIETRSLSNGVLNAFVYLFTPGTLLTNLSFLSPTDTWNVSLQQHSMSLLNVKKKKSVCVSALIGSSKPFSQNLSGTIWINPALVIGPYSKPV